MADRRIQRTQKRLQDALIELIHERNYSAITVQDIVDLADVGRTTFYDHYKDKDDLFLTCHHNVISGFHEIHQLDAFLDDDVTGDIVAIYERLCQARELLLPIFHNQEGVIILRHIRDRSAEAIRRSLQDTFQQQNSRIPIDMLANCLAGSQIALMQWWLETRQPYSAEELARAFHRLQRAAIRDAFEVQDEPG